MPPPLPIRFIGHYDVSAEGHFLWEILCQLRNMGAGRYVTKNEWIKKWPNESSYLRIIKARPEMDRWQYKGKLWAEWTFRGRNLGVYEFSDDLNRSDWKLIHKHNEKDYLSNKTEMPLIEIPNSLPVPSLQKYLANRQAAKLKKLPPPERIPMELCIDPQFEFLRPFIRLVEPKKQCDSIYSEISPKTYLDLYGEMLPPKVEAWMLGPAEKSHKFMPKSAEES